MLNRRDPWQPERDLSGLHGLELRALSVRTAGPDWLDPGQLDTYERERQRRLRLAGDRRSFLASHVLLRRTLATRLGCSPATIRLHREPCPLCGGPHGRPALADAEAGIHFSLSRTPDLVLVAVAMAPVGVDVEPVPEPATVAEVTPDLHGREREEIFQATLGERPAAFARLWTRKEAYLKGIGSGIATGLAGVSVAGRSGDGDPAGWSVRDLRLADGYAAAVAIQSSPW